jgi:hypothetical protein
MIIAIIFIACLVFPLPAAQVEDLEVRLRTQEQANMSHERQKVEVESMTEKDYQDTLAVRDKLLAENVSLKKYIVLSKRRNSSELRLHTEDLTVARKSIAALDIEVGRLQETEASLLATNGLLRGQVESAYGQVRLFPNGALSNVYYT